MDIVQRSQQNAPSEPQLVDRLDGAIGEASTSIGMMMSELVRRSLRGGVGEIGSTLQVYAKDQVSMAVAQAMPELTEQCEIAAEKTTLRIVDDVERRLGEELKQVEDRTSDNTQTIAAQIRSEADAAIVEVTRSIAESRETAESAARELKDLQTKARESWKKVQSELQQLNDGKAALEAQLQEARSMMSQTSQQISQQQQQLTGLLRQLEQSQREVLATKTQLMEQERQLQATRQQLVDATQQLTEQTQATAQQLNGLKSATKSMVGRLDEIERPKGIRALFSKFSGKKKEGSLPFDDNSEEIA